jgi:uncharacterized membrane protein YidH (DUF202 family)
MSEHDRHHEIREAGQRGALAWQRTAIALGAIGFLLVRQLHPLTDERPVVAAAFIGLGISCALLGVTYRRQRLHHDDMDRATALLTATGTAVIGVLAFGLALVPR